MDKHESLTYEALTVIANKKQQYIEIARQLTEEMQKKR